MIITKFAVAALLGAAPAGAQVVAAGGDHSLLPVERYQPLPYPGPCDESVLTYVRCAPGLVPEIDQFTCTVRCVEPGPKPRRPWHDEDRNPYRLLGEKLERQAAEVSEAVRGGDYGAAQGSLRAAFEGAAGAGGPSVAAVSAATAEDGLRGAALEAYTGRVYAALDVPAPIIIAGEKGAAAGAIVGGIGGGVGGGANGSVAGAGVGGLLGSKAEDAFNKKMDELGDKLRDRNDEKLRDANRQKEEAEKRWPRKN